MKSVNKCTFIGNLGSDPEVRYTGNGTPVANFSIACTEKWKDGEHTEWVRLVAWQRLAEIVQQYLHKGDPIYVEASARTRKWTDDNGIDRYITEYRVNDLVMLGGKRESGSGSGPSQPPQGGGQKPDDDMFDDIPF